MKIRTWFLSSILLLNFSFVSNSQDTCTCSASFEIVVQKIQENYIGYSLQKQSIEKEYQQHIQKFREVIKTTKEEYCTAIIQQFLQFFKDGHLFVLEYPNYNSEQLMTFKQNIQQRKINLTEIKKQLGQSSTKNIEGVWTDGNSLFPPLLVFVRQQRRIGNHQQPAEC